MIMIDGFPVDVAERETFDLRSTITGFPVESGGEIADHIQNEPYAITLEGRVSDTPLGEIELLRGVLDEDGRLASKPSTDAFAFFLAVRKRRQPVTIVCSRGTFESMALEQLSVNDDRDSGDALVFVASFKQIIVVTNQRTSTRVAEPRAQSKLGLGMKSSPTVTSAKQLPANFRPAADKSRAAVRQATAGGGSTTSSGRVFGPPAPLPGRLKICPVNPPPPNTYVPPDDAFAGGFDGGGFGGGGGGRSYGGADTSGGFSGGNFGGGGGFGGGGAGRPF
jgi:hypothetical protein